MESRHSPQDRCKERGPGFDFIPWAMGKTWAAFWSGYACCVYGPDEESDLIRIVF